MVAVIATCIGSITEVVESCSKIILLPFVVDYGRPVEKSIAVGNYDYVDPEILEQRFPIKRSGSARTTVELVGFSKFTSYDDVLSTFKRMKLRPAEHQEFFAIGEHCPQLQEGFQIVALQPIFNFGAGKEHWRCLSLSGRPGHRSVELEWVDNLDDNCKFAAVHL